MLPVNDPAPSARIKVCLRLDDYSAISDMVFEEALVALLRKYDCSCVFGVIPLVADGDWFDPHSNYELRALPDNKLRLLTEGIESGAVELALHGLTHQTFGKYNGRHHSEFAGQSFEEQYQRVKRGKELLDRQFGSGVDIFIPPWNSFDENTVKALDALEFTVLSSGKRFGGIPRTAVDRLVYLPALCSLITLRSAVRKARHSSDPNPVIVVLFHEYDFVEVNCDRGKLSLSDFAQLLSWLREQHDIEVCSFTNILKGNPPGATRFVANHAIYRFRRIVPSQLNFIYPDGLMLSISYARHAALRAHLWLIALYLLLTVISTALAFFILGSLTATFAWLPSVSFHILLILFLLVSVYALRNFKLYRRSLTTISVLLGFTLGALVLFLNS